MRRRRIASGLASTLIELLGRPCDFSTKFLVGFYVGSVLSRGKSLALIMLYSIPTKRPIDHSIFRMQFNYFDVEFCSARCSEAGVSEILYTNKKSHKFKKVVAQEKEEVNLLSSVLNF